MITIRNLWKQPITLDLNKENCFSLPACGTIKVLDKLANHPEINRLVGLKILQVIKDDKNPASKSSVISSDRPAKKKSEVKTVVRDDISVKETLFSNEDNKDFTEMKTGNKAVTKRFKGKRRKSE